MKRLYPAVPGFEVLSAFAPEGDDAGAAPLANSISAALAGLLLPP